jgi:hypothetical protein
MEEEKRAEAVTPDGETPGDESRFNADYPVLGKYKKATGNVPFSAVPGLDPGGYCLRQQLVMEVGSR